MGLGLSIVQAIARAHGGNATATPVDGGGLRVNVRLARSGPPVAMVSGDRPPP
jgi:signal transduction histidine kinase